MLHVHDALDLDVEKECCSSCCHFLLVVLGWQHYNFNVKVFDLCNNIKCFMGRVPIKKTKSKVYLLQCNMLGINAGVMAATNQTVITESVYNVMVAL